MRLIPLAILCALVGVTYWIGATVFTDRIEQDIAARTNTAIESYKPAVNLEVDGRDVTLIGSVRDERSREAALQTVDSVYGVRATRDSLAIMQAFNVHAKYSNGQDFIVKGTVDDLIANTAIEKTIAPKHVISHLNTGARPLDNSGAKLEVASDALAKMDHGEMWIDEAQMRITGAAPDRHTKAEVEQYLESKKQIIDPLVLITDFTAPALSENCQALAEVNTMNETILFEIDSVFIQDSYKAPLTHLIALVQECANDNDGNVLVEAHADHDGSEDYNFALSQKRADQVTQFLLDQGLSSNHIASFAFGETRPVASNETRSEKSFNRRVEVRFINEALNNNPLNQTIISTQSPE